jgi:hypothetical protein
MRLYEIIAEDAKILSAMPKVWDQKLRASGYRMIGRGRSAQVWAKPGDAFVVKVFRDDAYLEFVQLITAHQGNPHFPKIKGRLTKVRDHWAIRIERLSRLTSNDMIEAMQNYRQAHNELRFGFGKGTLPSFIEEMKLHHQTFRRDYPELAEALDLIFTTICDPHRWSVDWTAGNFRMRGKTVVISDPVAH